MDEEKKCCGRCSNYGALVNQGMWWCNAGHTDNMDAENCEDYDELQKGVVTTASSSVIDTMVGHYGIPDGSMYMYNQNGSMAKYKVMRVKKRRRKERGIKHGRR
jgi:hypothetical protein